MLYWYAYSFIKPPFHYAVLATICQFLQVGQDRVKWSRYGPWFSKVPDEKISSFQLPIVMKSYRSGANRAAQCLVRVIAACQTSIRSSHCVYAIITLFPLALRLLLIGKIGEKFWTCSKFLADLKNARSYPVLTTLFLRCRRLQTTPVRFPRSIPIC